MLAADTRHAELTLTSRTLEMHTVGTCSVCQQEGWLYPVVRFDSEDLPICLSCSSVLQSFERFAHGRAVRFQREPFV